MKTPRLLPVEEHVDHPVGSTPGCPNLPDPLSPDWTFVTGESRNTRLTRAELTGGPRTEPADRTLTAEEAFAALGVEYRVGIKVAFSCINGRFEVRLLDDDYKPAGPWVHVPKGGR